MAVQTEYLNSWHSARSIDPRIYRTDVTPIEYRGHQIFHRTEHCFDVVSDGICIAQYAGLSGAKGIIDKIHDNPTDFFAARSILKKQTIIGR